MWQEERCRRSGVMCLILVANSIGVRVINTDRTDEWILVEGEVLAKARAGERCFFDIEEVAAGLQLGKNAVRVHQGGCLRGASGRKPQDAA